MADIVSGEVLVEGDVDCLLRPTDVETREET